MEKYSSDLKLNWRTWKTKHEAAGGAGEFYFLVCQFRKLKQQRNFHLDAESFELKLEHEHVNIMTYFNIGLDIIIIIKVVLVLKVENNIFTTELE